MHLKLILQETDGSNFYLLQNCKYLNNHWSLSKEAQIWNTYNFRKILCMFMHNWLNLKAVHFFIMILATNFHLTNVNWNIPILFLKNWKIQTRLSAISDRFNRTCKCTLVMQWILFSTPFNHPPLDRWSVNQFN